MKKQFSPDAPTPNGSRQSPKTTAGVPVKDADLKDVSKNVAITWTATPDIILKWITAAQFGDAVNSYADELSQRLSIGSDRPSQTSNLKKLDALCNEGIIETKVYIQKKFKKAGAEAQYPRFGLSRLSNRSWSLPTDRNKRIEALKLMVAAIDKDGFANEEYGTNFWTDILNGYTTGLQTANATDSTVSTKVSGKNELKKLINKTMVSLRLIIRANYPDTYKAEFRKWGWQKEDY